MKLGGTYIRIIVAILAAAAVGSAVTVLITETPNPVREWMFALDYLNLGLGRAMRELPVTFLWALALVVLIGPACLWAMRRQEGIGPVWVIATVAAGFFLITASYELLFGIPGGSGNWQASNAGGLTLNDGLITPLGWLSTAIRSVIAGGVAGLTAGVFLAVCRHLTLSKDRSG
jgi:hypothetical protein